MMSDLNEMRDKIDAIDSNLVKLLNERAKVVVEVGEYKRKTNGAPPIYAPDRERAVLDKIKRNNTGPLPNKTLVAVYRELMSGSFFLERPLRIAFLGPEGSYSHQAAIHKFGKSVEHLPQADIKAVFEEIDRQHCDLGIVPVENSIGGGVIDTLDSFINSSVSICAELLVAIHHNLLAKCSLDKVKRIYSKPEAINQCRNWIASNFDRDIEIIHSGSTAQAAKQVMNEEFSAAVGSKLAGELYDLKLVCENIEDTSNNVTRFLVIGREPSGRTGNDKTGLLFSTADKAGALVDVLLAFRDNGVNLKNIESRPSRRRASAYNFFADAQGHYTDENMITAIECARDHCLQLSVLGSFPIATEVV
ncbi:MAG: prephenate dehydratase [Phycisphaerae bacterium]|nr:prephenate dehydratase [Phycisphaerae bacterium]